MKTAIVVDDEPITKMDLTEILQEACFNVVGQGADGFDAVELCRQYSPDVAIMDIKMPIFDGLGAAETIIREDLAGCVVLITAFNNSDFIEKAKQIGVGGYLVKPVEERMVIPTLEIAIAQSRRYMHAVDEARQMKRQIEEKALVDRAKLIVAKRDGITEGEAYALMRKMSMNKRCSMAEIALMIVSSGSEREAIERSKTFLMGQLGINESTAFRKIKEYSKSRGCSMEQAAVYLMNVHGDAASKRS